MATKTTKTKKPKPKFEMYESQIFGGKIVLNPETKKKRMQINAPHVYQNFLDYHTKEGDDISFYMTNRKPKRTDRQNRYLHLYLSLICLTHEGNTIEDLKCWIHEYCLLVRTSIMYGVQVKTVKSTSNLKIAEFCEMLSWVEDQTGIPLPDTEPFLKPLTHEEYKKLKDTQRRVYEKLVMKKIK